MHKKAISCVTAKHGVNNILRRQKTISWAKRFLLLSTAVLATQILAAQAFAAQGAKSQIKGTVTNGTASKPASGVEVVLLSLAGGMEEAGRGKTDGQGHFTFEFNDVNVPHLIRVDYQGASYFRSVPPGSTAADITIYDSAKRVDNIIAEGRIFSLQTVGGQLEVKERYILRNESKPPRTKAGDHSFEITLPQGAQLKDGMFAGASGMPITAMPSPTKEKGHYAFDNPLRPGPSQFQITYTLPYGGSQDFVIRPDMPTAEVGVMLPKSMQFKSSGPEFLQAAEESGMATYVAKSVQPGKTLQFSVSGEGTAPLEAQQAPPPGGPPQGGQPAGPGGGLGPPTNAPDPLSGLRWYVISGIVAIMAGGVFFALRRKPSADETVSPGPPAASPAPASRRGGQANVARAAQPAAASGSMMDVLKEELFQLESDRLRGKISQQEYESSKAGLETLLRRQLKNSGDSQSN